MSTIDVTKSIPAQIKVLYQDDNLFVLDKPFGYAVNSAKTTRYQTTIQDLLQNSVFPTQRADTEYLKSTDQITNPIADPIADFYSRNGIVHRLDKDTSGLLLVAKNPSAFINLQKQFADHVVKKEYVALVYGQIADVEQGQRFVIDMPIARSNKNRQKFAVDQDGKNAVTEIVIDQFLIDPKTQQKFTLLTCYPQTGRTHQIRVHLTAMGHPILGDKLYSGKKRYKSNSVSLARQFLHASRLTFVDPIKKTKIVVKSDLPTDLLTVLNSLHKL